MSERKSYGQFCGLARALDHVGDRWALLVVRELLSGGRTFGEVQDALAGISPSLLTKRLQELATDGLVERNEAPKRSKTVVYRLTEAGRALEPVVVELIRWGSAWMMSGPGDDHVDPRWAPLALKALLDGEPSARGRVHLDVEGVAVTVSSAGRRRVDPGHLGRASAHVIADLPSLLAVVASTRALDDADVEVSGDAALARELLTLGSMSPS